MQEICPSCGHMNREAARFCQRCGWLLETTGQPVTEIHPFNETLVRCSLCRKSTNVEICHVCGKLVCDQHKARPTLFQTYTQEYAPALSGKQKRAVHCEQHPHFVKSPLRTKVLPGLMMVILAFALGIPNGITLFETVFSGNEIVFSELVNPIIWLVLSVGIMAGGITLLVSGGGEFFGEYLDQVEGEVLQCIPVIPEQYVIRIKEWVDLELKIGDRDKSYRSIESAGGEISVQALLPSETEDIVAAYREKCRRNNWIWPRQLGVGFLAVDQLSAIEIPYSQRMPESLNVVPLRLSISNLRGNGDWQDLLNNTYFLKQETLFGDREGVIPGRSLIWLKPELDPNSAGRTLRLVFDLASEHFANKSIQLRELQMSIPRSGFDGGAISVPVERTNGRFYSDRWEVRWVDWNLRDDSQGRFPEVAFAQPITQLGQNLELAFEIEIEDMTLSNMRIDESQIWLPNGRRLQDGHVGIRVLSKTLLKGQAAITPDIFSHQYEVQAHQGFDMEVESLHADAIGLVTNQLESLGIYVRNVKENLPVTEPHEVMTERHTWDILGRQYVDINPIDVHIVLREHRAVPNPGRSYDNAVRVTAEVTLRSLATTKTAGFEQQVEGQSRIIAEALQKTLLNPSSV